MKVGWRVLSSHAGNPCPGQNNLATQREIEMSSRTFGTSGMDIATDVRYVYTGIIGKQDKDIPVGTPLNPAAEAESGFYRAVGFEETFVVPNRIADLNR